LLIPRMASVKLDFVKPDHDLTKFIYHKTLEEEAPQPPLQGGVSKTLGCISPIPSAGPSHCVCSQREMEFNPLQKGRTIV